MLQLITPTHVISGPPGGWHNLSCCQIEGLLQLYTGLSIAGSTAWTPQNTENVEWPGLRPGPRWGTLQRSPRTLLVGGG